MINELYELSLSLEQYGLLESATHSDVKNVGKVNCIVFELNNDTGMPCGLRYLQKQETAALWKHSKGNHHSFPAIRLQHPLLTEKQSAIMHDNNWAKADIVQKADMLKALDGSAVNSACTELHISDWTLQQLQPVLNSDISDLAALKKLVSIFPRSDKQAVFTTAVAKLVISSASHCQQEDTLDFFKKALVGCWNEEKKKYECGCMTYFDLLPLDDYDNLVASIKTQQALIKTLNTQHPSKAATSSIISPLSGEEVEALGDKYPNPNIPILGLTYLYSKKSDIPCLTRYTMSGVNAFRTGKHEINAINDALAYLTQESKKNKTWRATSDCNRDKPDLLLAYLPDNPQNNAYLAKILGSVSDYDDLDEFRDTAKPLYDALCQQVLGYMEHILQKNSQSKVNLILLEALDIGRKQIVYESSFTAERLCENLLEWGKASKNVPPIVFRYVEKKQLKEMVPLCPGPAEICQLLKINYIRSGSSKPTKASEVSLHEIYELYMPAVNINRTEALIDYYLERTVRKSALLLGDIGCKLTLEYTLSLKKLPQINQAAQFCSLLSILLYFKGVRKETFMLKAAFNIGQFLKLSDMLHKEYCIQVRNSGNKRTALPSQLMGNEMLTIATESPIEGLNRLCERMKIYLAWANTTTGESAGLAKWILARFEEVSLMIAEHELPEQFSPAEQAQVLLGYLSAIPYEKKEKDNDNQKEEKS